MNNISEKFLDYLQDNLNVSEESELFSILSYDEEKRNEFKNFLTIDKSLRKSAMSFIPPTNVTNSIFTKLGVNVLNPQFDVKADKVTSPPFIKSRFFSSMITGLVSISATILIMLYFMNSPNDSSKNNTLENNLSYNKQINNSNSTIEKSESYNLHNLPNDKSTKIRTAKTNGNLIRNGSFIASAEKNINEIPTKTETVNSTVQIEPDLNIKKELPITSFNVDKTVNLTNKLIPWIKYNDNVIDNSVNGNTGYQLEVNNSTYWNLPKETIFPNEFSKFNNLNINILYKLSEYITIGAGINQETFYVKYNGKDQFDRNYIKEQQPNLTVFDVVGRFYPVTIYNLKPFGEINLGGCNYGVVFRTGLGIDYLLSENIAAIFSVNYSVLGYSHQNNMYSSQKIGFYYGINYKF